MRDRFKKIEGRTCRSRFLRQTKMPYKDVKGFTCTVYNANDVEGYEVSEIAHIIPDEVKALLESNGSIILSVGDGME